MKLKGLAVVSFVFDLYTFFFHFGFFLFFLIVFCAYVCKSATIPVRNSCMTSLCYLSLSRSGPPPLFFVGRSVLESTRRLSRGVCHYSFDFIVEIFFSTVVSVHCIVFTTGFNPRTRCFHVSLSYYISTSSYYLVLGSMSINMSSCCLQAWVCLIDFIISRSSFTSFLSPHVFFHRLSGKSRSIVTFSLEIRVVS